MVQIWYAAPKEWLVGALLPWWGMVWTPVFMFSGGEEPLWSGFLTGNDTFSAYSKSTRHALRASDWRPLLPIGHPIWTLCPSGTQMTRYDNVAQWLSMCPHVQGVRRLSISPWACPLNNISINGKARRMQWFKVVHQYPDDPWCWYIYLQNWIIYRVNVAKYTSTMDHLGYCSLIPARCHFSMINSTGAPHVSSFLGTIWLWLT